MSKDQHSKSFWMAIAIIFILSFLTSYALAEEPVQIPVEEDFFIGQIVYIHAGVWYSGPIVDYNSTKNLYGIKIESQELGKPNDDTSTSIIYRRGSQLRPRSNRRSLQVLPDNPPIQNIKSEVEEIKPEFKFKKGEEVVPDFRSLPWADSVTTRIIDRAVLWGENVYRVERNRRRQPGDNGPGIWYETISEKDLQLPEKKQPEYVEGLQP